MIVKTTQNSKNLTISSLALVFAFNWVVDGLLNEQGEISQSWPKKNPECKKTNQTISVQSSSLWVTENCIKRTKEVTKRFDGKDTIKILLLLIFVEHKEVLFHLKTKNVGVFFLTKCMKGNEF